MKKNEKDETRHVEENPYPENEPLGIAWAFLNTVNPTPEQLKRFPTLLRPENEEILWALFDGMVHPKVESEPTEEDYESLRKFYERYPHVLEEHNEIRAREKAEIITHNVIHCSKVS